MGNFENGPYTPDFLFMNIKYTGQKIITQKIVIWVLKRSALTRQIQWWV